jgi:hypothetical protein
LSPSTFGWWAAILGDPTLETHNSLNTCKSTRSSISGVNNIKSSSISGIRSSNLSIRSRTIETQELQSQEALRRTYFSRAKPPIVPRRRNRRIVRFPILPLASPLPWCDLIPPVDMPPLVTKTAWLDEDQEEWLYYDVAKLLGLTYDDGDDEVPGDRSGNTNVGEVEMQFRNNKVATGDKARGEEAALNVHFFADSGLAQQACYAYADRGFSTNKNGAAKSRADQWVAKTAAAFILPSANKSTDGTRLFT